MHQLVGPVLYWPQSDACIKSGQAAKIFINTCPVALQTTQKVEYIVDLFVGAKWLVSFSVYKPRPPPSHPHKL